MELRVDRTRFLALTAGISASIVVACGKTTVPPVDAIDVAMAGDAGPSHVPIPVTTVDPTTRPAPTSLADPPPTATPPEPPLHACELALPRGVALNPTCEGMNWARSTCVGAQTIHPLPGAERVELQACLDRLAGTRAVCSVNDIDACSSKALGHVRPAEGTREPCERVIAVCGKKTTMEQCQGVLTVRPGFRERAEFCLVGPGKRCNTPGWCAFGDPDTKFIPRQD